MLNRSSKTLSLILPLALTAALAACGGDSTGSGGATGTTAGSGGAAGTTAGSGGAAGTTAGSGGGAGTTTGSGGASGCGAKVTIAFFSEADCSAASKVGQRAYDTGLDCFSWTAQGSNAQDNSATRFQCYDDRLCYTQHPETLTCAGGSIGATDKQAKNAECIKEPAGKLYSMIVGGNEGCPPPPSGFECPASAAGMGTDGIVACMPSP